ncbi:MAG: VOC family protein [Dehalococcoidia bacterium]|nr:VOC family protein [Dehalococcoidia bacterium]
MTAPTAGGVGQIAQISMTVSDIERSVAFYRDVLGIRHLFTAGQLAFFDCDGVRLMLDAMAEAQGRGNSVLYFRVSDIRGSQEALTATGVPFEGAPHRIHTHADGREEWMTFFRDPDGNLLALAAAVKP